MYGQLLALVRPYRWHLSAIVALGLLAAPPRLLAPLPLKIVIDSVIGSEDLPRPLNILFRGPDAAAKSAVLMIAIGLSLLTTLLSHLHSLAIALLHTYTGERLVLAFRSALFGHVQRLSLSHHDMRGSTDATYRIQWDANAIQNVLVTCGASLLTPAATLVGIIVVTGLIDPTLAIVALLICPILYVLTVDFRRRIVNRWHQVKELDSRAMSVVQEVLAALRVVKAFGREDHEQARFVRYSNARISGYLDLAYMQGRFDLFVGLTIALGTAAVLLIGVRHVQAHLLTMGDLLVVVIYLAQMHEPLSTISQKMADLQSALVGAERAVALLDEIPEAVERPHARPIKRADGAVRFRDVSFSYEKGHVVLSDVNFEVSAGAKVGIQGKTGTGKTTLINLLMRFYDPDGGAILLDGVDLRDYRVADLRNQIALVLQEPVLFSTTIAENILYGRPGASSDELVRAARLANAHDFITGLPNGYETQVGERGMRLSGGERQRIALARAFLKDAPLLILDEPTSAVDGNTEDAILEAIDRLMTGRTTFIIAHRLRTLEHCDLRLEIRDGRVLPVDPGMWIWAETAASA
jgi:ATP-binding cassette, subfamily B, bacterial